MKNHYKIIDYSELGLPHVEVYGDEFNYQDLYELVGHKQYMTTFNLKNGSESHSKYGDSVLGVIYYDLKTIKELDSSLKHNSYMDLPIIKVDSPERNIPINQLGDLKYKGINISDIESFSFLPYKRETEYYNSGEKKIPGIIKVEVDCSGTDVDILNQNYLASKNNTGTNLVQYEKEQLIGITLAFNGKIDSRLLNHLGFNESDLQDNLNVWQQLYAVKERRKQLTEIDCKNYNVINSIFFMEKMAKVIKEIKSTGLSDVESDSEKEILKAIWESVVKFSPSILLHGKNQVYWDLDSYIHVALRHVKDYQVGFYKNKTPFPYKAHDLKSLIEKVLDRVEDEIEQHLSQRTDNDFYRHGKMAILFNDDHYHLRISSEGRLMQFHVVQPTADESAD